MIQFVEIVDSAHLYWPFLTGCYIEAFPPDERRSTDELLSLIKRDIFRGDVLMQAGEPVGLMLSWRLGWFRYIEHFAMDAAVRGHGLGDIALNIYLQQSALPVVLEVEPPVDEIKCRRIRFYERIGFQLCSEIFIQPPYSSEKSSVELRLMEWGGKLLQNDFVQVKNELYRTVYGR